MLVTQLCIMPSKKSVNMHLLKHKPASSKIKDGLAGPGPRCLPTTPESLDGPQMPDIFYLVSHAHALLHE